jgi:hypothetical protein
MFHAQSIDQNDFPYIINRYKNPGKIINKGLCKISGKYEGNILLRDDLIEHYDFEAVSHEIWKFLASWYQFDIALPRFISYDCRQE